AQLHPLASAPGGLMGRSRPARRRSTLVTAGLAMGWLGLAAPAPAIALAIIANPDTLSAVHDRVTTVPAPGVLGNDVTLLGASAVLDTAPSHGSVTLRANGGYTYTPNASSVGADAFWYHATGVLPTNSA